MNFSSMLNPSQNGRSAPAGGPGEVPPPATDSAAASSSRMSFAFLDSAASRPMTPVFTSSDAPAPPALFAAAAPAAYQLHLPHTMSIQPHHAYGGFDPRLLTVQPHMLVDPAALMHPLPPHMQPMPMPLPMHDDTSGVVADSDDEGSRKPLLNGAQARAAPVKAEEEGEVDIMGATDEGTALAALKAQARASPAPKPRNKGSSVKSKSRSAQLASSTAGSPAPSPGPSSLANEVYPESSPAPSAVFEAPPEPEAPDFSFLPDIAPSEYHHPRLAPSVPRPRLPPAFEAYVPPRRSRFGADRNDSSSSDEDEEDVKRREQRRKAQAAAARERRLKAAKGGRGGGGAAEEEDDRLYCICQTLYDPERMMIACDRCEEWYHVDCMRIDEDEVELVDLFICPKCELNSPERTTRKSCCARPTCRHPAVPLSKYCSDYCGIAVAAARLSLLEADTETSPVEFWDLVKGATRREAEVFAVGAEAEDPQSLRAKAHARQDAADARLREKILARMAEASQLRAGLEAAIRLVEQRLAYLRVAIRRWETLCQATADEMVSAGIDLEEAAGQKGGGGRKSRGKRSGPSKKKGPVAATSLPDAQCGFDVRLVFDDKDWRATVETESIRDMLAAQAEGDQARLVELVKGDLDGVCLETRKRCDRHQGWQKIREADFAVEKAVLDRRLERLGLLADSLNARLAQHDETVGFRLANRSRTCAPEILIDVEDFMLDRAEDIEEQKASRPSHARRERSPSLHMAATTTSVSNGGGRHVAEKPALHPGRSRGATASHESTPTPVGAGANKSTSSAAGAVEAAGDDVPDDLLPYLSRADQARIKAQRERARAA
ncbi:hypothetical protein JCM3774_000984 [Rhodotorula dairenensis]